MKTTSYIFGIVAVGALLCGSSTAYGQDYDDIYYNPSKVKTQPKKEVKVTRSTTTTKTTTTYTPTPDYAASGTYNFNTGSQRDIDEYNRHSVSPSDNVLVQTGDTVIDGEEFQYTRRIERFHNPDVVVNTNDDDLIDYYYTVEPTASTSVNVYVNADPWNTWISPFTWSSPYYSYWNWNWGWNGPWYGSYWGPSFSWGWYDPWYSWTWGPSFSWGWGWGGGWNPGPPYPNYGWANNWWPTGTGAGSSRPHPSTSRPAAGTGIASAGGGYNPTVRPGSGAGTITGNTPTTRPGNMGRGRTTTYTTDNNGVVTARPGSTVSGTNRWPASVNASTSGSSTSTRGRTTTAPATTTRQPVTNTYNNNNNSRNTNTRTYNSNSNSTRNTYSSPGSSSRSSFGGGSSGGFGGGSHSSGGSGSRGRR